MPARHWKSLIGNMASCRKLAETQEKLAARQANGNDTKSLDKTQSKISTLQQAMNELQASRKAAEDYTRQLQDDIRQTLRIGKGLERIEGQAGQAIEKRGKPPTATRAKSRQPGTPRRKPRNPAQTSGQAS